MQYAAKLRIVVRCGSLSQVCILLSEKISDAAIFLSCCRSSSQQSAYKISSSEGVFIKSVFDSSFGNTTGSKTLPVVYKKL